MRRLPSLRQLLLLLALACVLPMAGLALGLVGFGIHHERDQVQENAVTTARALMAAVDDRFLRAERALLVLARSPALEAGDFVRLHEEAELLRDSAEVTNLLLVDADGRQWMNTDLPWDAQLPSDPSPPKLEALRRKEAVVVDLFLSRTAGAFRVGVGVPAILGGRPMALNANIDPALLREVLARQNLPPGWIAAVVDRSGAIVARTHDHERFTGTPARAALLARIAQVPEDAVESVTLEGIPVVTAFSRSAHTGWSVLIGIPRAEINAPVLRSTVILLAGSGLVLAITVLVAWKLAASLSASVEALGGAVRASGHRANLELPEATFQEARQLGQAFAHAHAAVEDAYAALANREARIRAVLDAATEAIVTADEQGRIILFNPAAEVMFRLATEEALGQPLESLLPPAHRARHREMRQHTTPAAARQMADGRVIECLRGDGTVFHAQASISAAESEEGRMYTVMLREMGTEGGQSTEHPPAG